MYFRYYAYIPLKNSVVLHLKKIITQRCFVPSLVEIDLAVLEFSLGKGHCSLFENVNLLVVQNPIYCMLRCIVFSVVCGEWCCFLVMLLGMFPPC